MPNVVKPTQSQPDITHELGQRGSWIDNYRQATNRELGLEILNLSNGTLLYFKPHTDIDKGNAYLINIKGVVHVVPIENAFDRYWKVDAQASAHGASGIDKTNRIGYRLDGSTGTGESLNVWAFANDDNDEFEGFGLTRTPTAGFANLTVGTMGALTTLTGLTQTAHQFTPGATVGLRNAVTGPPYQWNYGIVQSIVSTTSLTVKLYPSLDFNNTNLTTGIAARFIQQIDKYFPWNGRSDTTTLADLIWKKNYRLVGRLVLDTNYIANIQRADDKFTKFSYPNADNVYSDETFSHASATTTTLTMPLARLIAAWTKSTYLQIEYDRDGWDLNFEVINKYGGGVTRTEYEIYDTTSSGTVVKSFECIHNQNMEIDLKLTTSGAGGTATVKVFPLAFSGYDMQEL